MKILVINGSPSGSDSITLQTVKYIRLFHPEHEWSVLDVGKRIKSVEKDPGTALEAVLDADMLLFCYPVYTFLAPSQLHRFIRILKESGADISGKTASQITTSKHFYDVTAHDWLNANCLDLGLNVIRGLSADMEDLLSEKGRKEALSFFDHLMFCAGNGIFIPSVPGREAAGLKFAGTRDDASSVEKDVSRRVVIVADLTGDSGRLSSMIDRFVSSCRYSCDTVDIGSYPFAGGCLGCFGCAADGKCVYRDGFDAFLRENIQTADATVYAFRIEDHSMGYMFKTFDDRQFCNGHRTVTMGKPVGYLVDGCLGLEPSLSMMLEARAQVGGNYLAGIATTEADPDALTDRLALNIGYAVEKSYAEPAAFYGVGGMKIFRDLIYTMRGLMREDHRFYKKHGFYDFPQKRRGTIIGMYLAGMAVRSKGLRTKIGSRMTEGMLMPYSKVLKEAEAGLRKSGSDAEDAAEPH